MCVKICHFPAKLFSWRCANFDGTGCRFAACRACYGLREVAFVLFSPFTALFLQREGGHVERGVKKCGTAKSCILHCTEWKEEKKTGQQTPGKGARPADTLRRIELGK